VALGHVERVSVQTKLLAWAAESRRDLPWRRTRDPWAVLVSELMLQQTQVSRVAPRWAEFLERFPAPEACAKASVGDVVRAWAGLGYNRRAVSLHRTAVIVVERHGGRVPAELPALLALPGVGSYVARAVLVFAFEADAAVLDTNAARVMARAVAGRRIATRSEAQALADSLVPAGRGWAWNQAMLDLGALVCTRRHPDCGHCPLARRAPRQPGSCRWDAAARRAPDPAEGSVGVAGRQAAFAGSDRQGRGRLVDALRRSPVPAADLAAAAGWSAADGATNRARRIADSLVADGLAVVESDGRLRLA
jgi:A/G-specific adenine glycosylase